MSQSFPTFDDAFNKQTEVNMETKLQNTNQNEQSGSNPVNDVNDEGYIEESYDIQTYESFEDLNLNPKLLRGIFSYGYDRPSAPQSKGIKPLSEGQDLILQAQSGTGKTGTFIIGSLNRVDVSNPATQVIVMSPNRELSDQIYQVYSELNKYMKTTGTLLIGGTAVDTCIKTIEKGAQVVIGTPGRIYDMLKRGILKTTHLKSMILDEADEMLSRGFQDQVQEIFQFVPESAQIAIFSATMPPEALDITRQFMPKPVRVLVKKEQLTLDGIRQYYIGVAEEGWKLAALCQMYTKLMATQCIVFCNSKRKANWLKEELISRKYECETIHGDMKQNERNKCMSDFRKGNIRILISTDLTARGIDVQQVSTVINYDIPKQRETYIHRIGRSGRFGRKGLAINFILEQELEDLRAIEQYYNTQIDPVPEDYTSILE